LLNGWRCYHHLRAYISQNLILFFSMKGQDGI